MVTAGHTLCYQVTETYAPKSQGWPVVIFFERSYIPIVGLKHKASMAGGTANFFKTLCKIATSESLP